MGQNYTEERLISYHSYFIELTHI